MAARNAELERLLKQGEIVKELLEKNCIETKLSKISADLIGKKIRFKAVVVGESVGKAFERKMIVSCKACGKFLAEIDLAHEDNFILLYEKLSTGRVNQNKLMKFITSKCSKTKNRQHILDFEYTPEFEDFSIIFVKELPEQIEALNEKEFQSLASKVWRVFYLGIPKDAKRVEIEGYATRNRQTSEIEFVAYNLTPLEDEFVNLKITVEDHKKFREFFSNDEMFQQIVENQVAPHIVGRNFEKLTLLLTLHSPYEIFDIFNSRKIRGCIRTIWIGDTKTGKSEMGKDITYVFYKIGEMVIGETSTRAGLVYTIDTETRTIIWGTLPLNDRKFVFIDGIHTLQSDEMAQMREVLEQQFVRVSRSVSGERFARVRILATLNPKKRMKDYFYKIQALMDTTVFRDPVDLTRWDIVVPFSDGDVTPEAIAEARPKERPIPPDIFRKHVLWSWSLHPNQIRYSEDAKELIIRYSKELLSFSSADYPLIHSGVRDVITRIAVAFACLKHSVELDDRGEFQYVEVKSEHVEDAKKFLEEMIQRIDYDGFVMRKRGETELSDEEFEEICRELDGIDIQIMEMLVSGAKKSPELASLLGITDRSVREHYNHLRNYNLIVTSQGFGTALTSRGIGFLKKYTLHLNVENRRTKENERLSLVKPAIEEKGIYSDSYEDVKRCEAESEKITSQRFTTSQQPAYTTLSSQQAMENKHESVEIGVRMKNGTTHQSRLHSDVINLVLHPPLGKKPFDFEVISFLSQRGYRPEEIERGIRDLLNWGIIILTPDGRLDVNFGKLGGGSYVE